MSLRCEIIPVTAFQQNCSLIWDDATMRGALVDAGGETERLLERAKHHGVTIEKMLVTHRSEEHTSELQSLMRISYAVFCLKKNNNNTVKHKQKERKQEK